MVHHHIVLNVFFVRMKHVMESTITIHRAHQWKIADCNRALVNKTISSVLLNEVHVPDRTTVIKLDFTTVRSSSGQAWFGDVFFTARSSSAWQVAIRTIPTPH